MQVAFVVVVIARANVAAVRHARFSFTGSTVWRIHTKHQYYTHIFNSYEAGDYYTPNNNENNNKNPTHHTKRASAKTVYSCVRLVCYEANAASQRAERCRRRRRRRRDHSIASLQRSRINRTKLNRLAKDDTC